MQILSYRAVLLDPGTAEHRGRGDRSPAAACSPHITPEFAAEAARMMRSGAVHWFQIRSVVVDALWSRLRPFLDGLYLSFESGLHAERITDAFPPRTLARLRDLKATYDPGNVLRDNFTIAPVNSIPEGASS